VEAPSRVENVFESEDGRSEKRRDFPLSPLLAVFFLENPKEVRRLDSMLGLAPDVVMVSLDMGPAMEVGG
jgi:hypothetical protein